MTQMNLSTEQNHRHREQICVCQGGEAMGEGWIGSWELTDANIIDRMDKQQGPTVKHRELYSISCDKP